MQFNAVVETKPGRSTSGTRSASGVATVPEAFDDPRHGLVGLHVMHRVLTPDARRRPKALAPDWGSGS